MAIAHQFLHYVLVKTIQIPLAPVFFNTLGRDPKWVAGLLQVGPHMTRALVRFDVLESQGKASFL